MTIYLGLKLPTGSSDYKERGGPPLNAPNSILLRVGFTGRTSRHAAGELLPRLSILAPNAEKRYFRSSSFGAVYFCCTFLGVASTGRYPAPCPVELGLSSYGHRRMRSHSLLVFAPLLIHPAIYYRCYASEYSILPQFSHSTIPVPLITDRTTVVGSDMLHPPHRSPSSFAKGTACFFLIVLYFFTSSGATFFSRASVSALAASMSGLAFSNSSSHCLYIMLYYLLALANFK